MGEHTPSPAPTRVAHARPSVPPSREGALLAFAPGELPWGDRPAGAPEGRGVRVFVIDSGTRSRRPADAVAGGPGAAGLPGGALRRDRAPGDEAGSGKAITALIRHVAPAAEVLAVRIFGRGATTTVDVLEGALDFARRSQARVVSLGLVVAGADDPGRVRALCRDALRDGVVLIAAAEGPRRGHPAVLPEVIGAAADARLGPRSLRYVRGAPFECHAAGSPLPPAGGARERTLAMHGFAAARVAGMVACILEARPGADLAAVRDALEAHFAPRDLPRRRATGS